MRPFAATSIPLQDPDVIEDRPACARACLAHQFDLGTGEWEMANRLRPCLRICSMPTDIAGNQHDEEKFGSRKAPELLISYRNVVTITSSSA